MSVSTATRLFLSWDSNESKTASEIASAILSGCPSVTDSDVKSRFDIFNLTAGWLDQEVNFRERLWRLP